MEKMTEAEKEQDLSVEGILRWLARQTKLDFPTGTRWKYNNTNYFLLARVVERVSKEDFATFLKREVFLPAQMSTAQVLDQEGVQVSNRAQGYTAAGKPARWDDAITGPANVFASLDDLIAWDRALTTGAILKREALLEALKPGRFDDGRPVSYGLGFSVNERHGHRCAWHDGDWIGASAYVARYLDDDLFIALLSNADGVPVDDLEQQIATIFLHP
jgi:CubicO group peptidase (beta-lactamase class C family)